MASKKNKSENRQRRRIMNNEVKIVLTLNGEEASLILAALHTAKDMMNHSMDLAIKDGILPVVALVKEEINKIDEIVREVTNKHSYESKSFVVDEETALRKMERSIAAIKLMQDKMDEEDTPPPEKGKKWDDAGDNVINILGKLKKDDKDE